MVHGWPPHSPGGTELYAHWLAARQARDREVFAYARVSRPDSQERETHDVVDQGVRVRLVVNNFTSRNPLIRNALRDPAGRMAFAGFLDETRPDVVHVHHLAGHSLDLLEAIQERGLPLVLQVQDWWLLCARSNMLQPDRSLCSGPGFGKCSRCLPLTRRPPAALWSRLLYAYRRWLSKRWIARADALVMGSRFIEESCRRMGLFEPASRIHVIPYGVEPPACEAGPEVRPDRRPLKFGYIGSIMPHKGVHVAVEAFRGIDRSEATLGVWGDTSVLPDYTREMEAGAPPAVEFRGRFDESEKPAILAGIDVLLVPSLGLESFGIVVQEALACGVPVLASRRGALQETLKDGLGGAFFEPGDVEGLRRRVQQLAADRRDLEEWARHRPPVRSMESHVPEIDAIYSEVLNRRRTRARAPGTP